MTEHVTANSAGNESWTWTVITLAVFATLPLVLVTPLWAVFGLAVGTVITVNGRRSLGLLLIAAALMTAATGIVLRAVVYKTYGVPAAGTTNDYCWRSHHRAAPEHAAGR